eukprot:scaffold8721_cov80-Phaeocystis_antarctica.AAC.15
MRASRQRPRRGRGARVRQSEYTNIPSTSCCWTGSPSRHARLHELQAPKLGEEACMLIRVSHHTPRLKPSCPAAEILPRTRPQLQGPPWMRQGSTERERERHHESECATCSIISVLTQWGATLVIQLRERERENLGDFAPKDVVPPRYDGAPRTAKYQAALDGGHDVLVLISEVWGGFSPEAMRFLGELAQARNDGIDIERATWSTSSFTSYHGQLLSLAVQWGVAIEIERAIKKSASFC